MTLESLYMWTAEGKEETANYYETKWYSLHGQAAGVRDTATVSE